MRFSFYHYLFIIIFFFSAINSSLKAQNCTVNAGTPKTICDNSDMQLQGNSVGNFAATASWSQIGGPSVNISNPADLNTGITGHVGSQKYTFRISATCSDGVKVYDDVIITVDPVS